MNIGLKKTIILLILFFITAILLYACTRNEKAEQNQISTTQLTEPTETPDATIAIAVPIKDIVDADGIVQGYVEIYDDCITYVNKELGYSFDLPKSWEDHFIVDVNYETKFISLRFSGESEEGRGIHPNGKCFGLCIFEIIYETDFEGLMFEGVYYLGTVDGIKLYHIIAPDCEICALYDEIEMYEYGESKYQNDGNQIELMRRDLETVNKMVKDYDYEKLNFQPLE